MKKLIYIIVVVLFSSCGDFLEESSQDLIIPKTVKDYSEFLFGEGYIRNNTSIHTYLDIMTDDVEEKRIHGPLCSQIFGGWVWLFLLATESEYRFTGALNTDNAWETYYSKILIANNVIDLLDDAEGIQSDKDDLLGEAYFCVRIVILC